MLPSRVSSSPCNEQSITVLAAFCDLVFNTGGAFEEEYEEAAPPKKELFYTEGTAFLKQARLQIAHFSLDRAVVRLTGAKRKRESPDEDEAAEQADTIALMRKVCATEPPCCASCHVMGQGCVCLLEPTNTTRRLAA